MWPISASAWLVSAVARLSKDIRCDLVADQRLRRGV